VHRQKTQARWRRRNPGYAIAYRIDQRAAQTEAPAVLRVPAPLNQLPGSSRKTSLGSKALISLELWERSILLLPYLFDYTLWSNAKWRKPFLCTLPPNPARKQRVKEEIVAFIAIQDISGIKRLKSLLNGRRWSETELFTDALGVDFGCSAVSDRL
jgi:hypothetical protein